MATIITDFKFSIFFTDKAPANDREVDPSRAIKMTAEIEQLLNEIEATWPRRA